MFCMFSSKIRYYPRLPLSRDIKAFKWLLVTWYNWKISRISMAVRVPTWLKRIVCPSSARKIEHSTNAEVNSGHPRQREKRVTRTIAGQWDVGKTAESNAIIERNAVLISWSIFDTVSSNAFSLWPSIACHSCEKSKNVIEMRGQGIGDYRKGWGNGEGEENSVQMENCDRTIRRRDVVHSKLRGCSLVCFNESSRMEIAIAFQFGNYNYCAGR